MPPVSSITAPRFIVRPRAVIAHRPYLGSDAAPAYKIDTVSSLRFDSYRNLVFLLFGHAESAAPSDRAATGDTVIGPTAPPWDEILRPCRRQEVRALATTDPSYN
jgi:hypothetical protein